MRNLFHFSPTPRILLFFIAIVIKLAAAALAAIGFVLDSPALMISGVFVWLVWFAVLLLIAVPKADQFLKNQMHWLKPAALVIFIVLVLLGASLFVIVSVVKSEPAQIDQADGDAEQVLTSFDRIFAYNDATALCHQATNNLLDGQNPYAEANVVTAMIEFNGSIDKLTPLREGSFAQVFPYPNTAQLEQLWQEAIKTPEVIPVELESKLGYPAGSFLWPAPFVLMGINDLRIIFLILVIPALAYAIWRTPRDLRLLLAGALIISLELWNALAAGETGLLYFPFLLLAWILPKKHLWLSALFMGLAVATKQVAWFFVPFYLILIFRTESLKSLVKVAAIIVGVFLVTNAPFMAMDPQLWLNSIMAPVTDNLFPLGVGIVSLVSGGFVDIQSPLIFTILEVCLFALAIIWYFFNCRRYPYTGPILAVLPLFFAWRSLWAYFFYVDIIVLAAILINEYGAEPAALVSPGNKEGETQRQV
jgi:hypothetical protein